MEIQLAQDHPNKFSHDLRTMTKNKKRKLAAPNNSKHVSPTQKGQHPKKPQPAKQHLEPIIPFDVEDRILLVGEGDFSFAKSMVEHHGCCDLTPTCLDTKDEISEKYSPRGPDHIQYLEDEGQTVLYQIDATKLNTYKALKKGSLFERIIFNFPHVGGKSKDVNRQVRFNQELLVKFFTAALSLLTATGTIIVTLFEGEPYTLWNIRDLARHSGLEVQRSFKFMAEVYPGYGHARTLGNIEGGGGWKGEERDARSYVFQRKGAQQSVSGKKRRRGADSSDEDG